MTVSIPIDVTEETCSEPDKTRKLEDLIWSDGTSAPIEKNLKLIDATGDNIYNYSLDKTIYIHKFDKDNPKHHVGDIVVQNRKHYIITAKNDIVITHKVPKEPDEYASSETSFLSFKTWTKRYMKLPRSKAAPRMRWNVGGKTYFIYWSNKNGCGHCKGSWVWKVRDNTTGNRCHAPSSYTCINPNDASYFHLPKDIIGEKKLWAGHGGKKEECLFLKSFVERGENFYLRTWVDAPIEYKNVPVGVKYSYALRRIYGPKEIPGFKWYKTSNCMAVFDDKNYTEGVFNPSSGYVDFSMVATDRIDTIALGRVTAKSVSVDVRDGKSNNLVARITKYPIETQIADTQFDQSINMVLYTPNIIEAGSKINVRVHGSWVNIGRVLVGRMLKLGFTNTKFENSFKDFSPMEQDQWGNIDYRNGIRVYVHSGTVDMPLKDYDMLNRAFMMIGGREVIINSSDSHKNSVTNSLDIFQSTMLIGRFTAFKQTTKNVGGIMDNIAGYSFSVEESV